VVPLLKEKLGEVTLSTHAPSPKPIREACSIPSPIEEGARRADEVGEGPGLGENKQQHLTQAKQQKSPGASFSPPIMYQVQRNLTR